MGAFQIVRWGQDHLMADGALQRNLAERVAEAVDLGSAEEARAIVQAVTAEMAAHFPSEAWDIVSSVVASDLVGDIGDSGRGRGTIKGFFMAVGDRTDFGTAVAARYSRVVAEEIGRELDEGEMGRLRSVLDDDFLALFESDHRGELTEDDGTTEGARAARSPAERRPPPSRE